MHEKNLKKGKNRTERKCTCSHLWIICAYKLCHLKFRHNMEICHGHPWNCLTRMPDRTCFSKWKYVAGFQVSRLLSSSVVKGVTVTNNMLFVLILLTYVSFFCMNLKLLDEIMYIKHKNLYEWSFSFFKTYDLDHV